jgi:hypothetical protein
MSHKHKPQRQQQPKRLVQAATRELVQYGVEVLLRKAEELAQAGGELLFDGQNDPFAFYPPRMGRDPSPVRAVQDPGAPERLREILERRLAP